MSPGGEQGRAVSIHQSPWPKTRRCCRARCARPTAAAAARTRCSDQALLDVAHGRELGLALDAILATDELHDAVGLGRVQSNTLLRWAHNRASVAYSKAGREARFDFSQRTAPADPRPAAALASRGQPLAKVEQGLLELPGELGGRPKDASTIGRYSVL